MLTLFILGSWWSLGIFVATFLSMMVLVEVNQYGWTFLLMSLMTGVFLWANPELGKSVTSNPLLLVVGFVGYVILGVVWAFFKWYMLLVDHKEQFQQDKKNWQLEWVGKNPDRVQGNSMENEFKEYIKGRSQHTGYGGYRALYIPQASSHKAKITGWLAYWPVSVANFVLFDFLRRCYTTIYNRIHGIFQGMSDRMFGGPAF